MAAGIGQQTRKRAKQAPQAAAQWATARQAMEAQLPNSAQLEMARQVQENGSGYADALKAKFMEHQLPSAEREADRIAAGIHASTPEQVKEQLGEKMGADFSGVRFHTDASSAGQADTIGARAFTTGRDVYFGQGGFDAGVAAHELVHTVQQGSVAADMGTMSAPAGEVQMKPNGFMNKMARLWEITGGAIGRSHRRAYEDIMRNKTDNIVSATDKKGKTITRNKSTYYGIGKVNRMLNFMHNPLAVMRSWFSNKSDWKKAQDQKDAAEKKAIDAYRKNSKVINQWVPAPAQTNASTGASTGVQTTGSSMPQAVYQPGVVEGDPDYNMVPMDSVYDTVTSIPNLIGTEGKLIVKPEVPTDGSEAKENYTAFGVGSKVGMGIDALDALQTGRGLTEKIKDVRDAFGTGLTGEKVGSVTSLLSQAADTITGIGTVMGDIGDNFDVSDKIGKDLGWMSRSAGKISAEDTLGYISDGLKLFNNAVDIGSGLRTKGKMSSAEKKIGALQSGDDKTRLETLAKQGRRGASHRLLKGFLGAIPNGLNVVKRIFGKAMPILDPILGGSKYVTEKVGDFALSRHQKSMNKDVLNQEMNLEQEIENYADQLVKDSGKSVDDVGALDYRAFKKKAKHIILRAHGFSSGKRSEAAAYFNDQRANYLAKHANDAVTNGKKASETEKAARKLVQAIGVSRHGGEYQEDDISKRLGRGASREDAAKSRGSNIKALGQQGRGFKNAFKRFAKWIVGA